MDNNDESDLSHLCAPQFDNHQQPQQTAERQQKHYCTCEKVKYESLHKCDTYGNARKACCSDQEGTNSTI